MKCSKCGFDNPTTVNYCLFCGHRLDEKIMCPKCHNMIENDAESCDKCGFKLPKEKVVKPISEKAVNKHKRLDKVFSRILAITAIVIAAFLVHFAFVDYLSFTDLTNNSLLTESNVFYYIFKQWSDFESSSLSTKTRMIALAIITVLNAISTVLIGTLTIKRAVCAIRTGSKNYMFPLAAMLGFSLFTSVVVMNFYYSNEFNYVTQIDFEMNGQLSLLYFCGLLYFVFAMILKIIFDYDPKYKTQMTTRILLTSLFVILFAINVWHQNCYIQKYTDDVQSNYGCFYTLTETIGRFISLKYPKDMIPLVMSETIASAILLVEFIFVPSFMSYLIGTFFSTQTFRKRLIVPVMFLSIFLMLLGCFATISGIISIITYENVSEIVGESCNLGIGFILSGIGCVMAAVLGIASMMLMKIYYKRARLISQRIK